jgi:hypothetical protein
LSGRILQKNLTVSTIVAQSKVYDGSTLASVVVAGADYEGLVENDKVLISSTGVFDSKNVGSGKAVSLSNTFSGEDVGNYVITAQGTATADITARALMISGIVAADKIFDGNRSAVLNTRASVFSGLLAGDDVCLTAQGQFADEAAGSAKVVTISSVFSGADAGNYLIAPQTTTTATITERIVTTVTAAPVPPPPPPPAAPAPAAPAPVAAPAAVDSAAADAPAASADSAPAPAPEVVVNSAVATVTAAPLVSASGSTPAVVAAESSAPVAAPVAPAAPVVMATAPTVRASTPVSSPPPSPVGEQKPATPQDAADSGDKTLSMAAAPPAPKPAAQSKRLAAQTVFASIGGLGIPVAQPPVPPVPKIADLRFSLWGTVF